RVSPGMVHGLTGAAFPLQCLTWYLLDGFDFLAILSVLVHVNYYIRLTRRGEKQFMATFFYFEVGAVVVQLSVFCYKFSNNHNYVDGIWMITPCLLVQVAACFALFCHYPCATDGELTPLLDKKEDAQLRRQLLNIIPIAAFPLQIFFYFHTFSSHLIWLCVTASFIVHVLYALHVFGVVHYSEHYTSHFFYYGIFVLFMQSILINYDSFFNRADILPFRRHHVQSRFFAM
ncbi:hypothetical protein PMAYCL1PPCAC_03355, partial [Pristionchus mayeri]